VWGINEDFDTFIVQVEQNFSITVLRLAEVLYLWVEEEATNGLKLGEAMDSQRDVNK